MNITSDSIKNLCGISEQAKIHGWQHCNYGAVKDNLPKSGPQIKKTFSYAICSLSATDIECTTLEGRVMEKMTAGLTTKSECKAALTTLILENYKRKIENLPIIPLIFCYDIENNPFKTDYFSIASRTPQLNKLITNSELRRTYKLIHLETNSNHHLKEIGKIAKETFKFVRFEYGRDPQNQPIAIKLIPLPPFWEHPCWDTECLVREGTKNNTIPSTSSKTPWEKELLDKIRSYRASKNLH